MYELQEQRHVITDFL